LTLASLFYLTALHFSPYSPAQREELATAKALDEISLGHPMQQQDQQTKQILGQQRQNGLELYPRWIGGFEWQMVTEKHPSHCVDKNIFEFNFEFHESEKNRPKQNKKNNPKHHSLMKIDDTVTLFSLTSLHTCERLAPLAVCLWKWTRTHRTVDPETIRLGHPIQELDL
jgi:hypothetical protein